MGSMIGSEAILHRAADIGKSLGYVLCVVAKQQRKQSIGRHSFIHACMDACMHARTVFAQERAGLAVATSRGSCCVRASFRVAHCGQSGTTMMFL